MFCAEVAFDGRELEQLLESVVVDVSPSQRDHGNGRLVGGPAMGLQQSRQHDLLAVAFSEDDQPREVQLGEGLHGLAHKLVLRPSPRASTQLWQSGVKCDRNFHLPQH